MIEKVSNYSMSCYFCDEKIKFKQKYNNLTNLNLLQK